MNSATRKNTGGRRRGTNKRATHAKGPPISQGPKATDATAAGRGRGPRPRRGEKGSGIQGTLFCGRTYSPAAGATGDTGRPNKTTNVFFGRTVRPGTTIRAIRGGTAAVCLFTYATYGNGPTTTCGGSVICKSTAVAKTPTKERRTGVGSASGPTGGTDRNFRARYKKRLLIGKIFGLILAIGASIRITTKKIQGYGPRGVDFLARTL